jgi:hypothetical protein
VGPSGANADESPPDESGYSVLAGYAQKHLERQDARKSSLEQRGLGVITTSGVLVTLLFGLAALSTKAQTFALPKSAGYFLVLALVLFFAAAITAILTNVPLEYDELQVERLYHALAGNAPVSRAEAERRNARTDLEIVQSAKDLNEAKARLLLWAMGLEIAAVAAVAVAIGIVVNGGVFAVAVALVAALGAGLYIRAYGLARPREGAIADVLKAAGVSFAPRGRRGADEGGQK